MQIAVLADESSWYFRDLERAARDRGHRCHRADFARVSGAVIGQKNQIDLSTDTPITTDCVVVRSMPAGSLEQVVLRMDLLARLEASGVLVVNPPKSLECAIDKYLTTAKLAAAQIPVPDTVCCQNASQALEWFTKLGSDVVVKPLFGAEGRGIVRVSDPDMAWRVFTTLERMQAAIYLQRYIDHGGCDYRVLVLGQQVLGGMQRSSTTDFRTNVARQGTAEPHKPTASEADLALRAAQVIGTSFAGVDLMYDSHGELYVIEVNAVPGWQAFARVNALDVATEFVKSLEIALKDRK